MRYPRFSCFKTRLKTFECWNQLANPVELSKFVFFYLGGGDQVQCFHCAIILHTWKSTDRADFEHLKHSPSCAFIRNICEESYRFSENLMLDMLEMVHEQSRKITALEIEVKQLYHLRFEDEVDISLGEPESIHAA